MEINVCFKDVLKKFKSELEREENYINDGFFAPIKELNHLEISDEVDALCECVWEEIKKEPDRKAYLKRLKNEYEKILRKPLLDLIDEVYYYSDNVIPLHNKEKKAIGIFLKPANECSEDFINEHQAIKTYRCHFQSIDEDVTCDYAIEAISEIWNRIEMDMFDGMSSKDMEDISNLDFKESTETSEVLAKYPCELLALFKFHTELIDELVGKSNGEIAGLINNWAKGRDGAGRALIENPKNNMRSTFARELKAAGLIQCSVDWFSRLLK